MLKAPLDIAIALALLTASCSASPRPHASAFHSEGPEETNWRDRDSGHEEISNLARELGINVSRGSNYAYVEKLKDGTYAVIYETFPSRSRYKTITPIWKDPSGIFMDCSYIHSIEDHHLISVGSYCRGDTPASSEAIEDAINDEYIATFTSDHAWLRSADAADCSNRLGIEYDDYRIVRCIDGEEQETSEGVTTSIFSSDLSLLARFPGFEFSGSSGDGRSFVLWKLYRDSPHELATWSP